MSDFWTKIRDSIWDRNEVSITDLGQFCGPNWTNGVYDPGSGSPVKPDHPPENYKIRDALYDVDAACKVHDTAYEKIQNSDESEAYKAEKKYKADKELLEDWSQVDSSELSWAEKAYLALGTEYFKHQVEAYEAAVLEEHTGTAELAGAGASAAFMSYARLAGWTEESWLDEAWEQGVASFAITEVAKDIADWNFEGSDYNLFDWNAAGGSLVASLAANALGDELGLGGTDAASTVGASMAIAGMSYSIRTLTTANAVSTMSDFAGSTSLTQGGKGLLGSMASAGAGALGTWAASQVLHSHTNAEAIGAAVGGTIGAAVGSIFFPPLGTAIGAYLGSVLGDSLGETWNEVGELFDDGFQLEDIGAVAWEILIEAPADIVMAIFGFDEEPPPPVAEVGYEFNADTGAYERTHSHARDGGEVAHVEGAGDQITTVVDQLLAHYTQGEAQLANRHEMPAIKVGYAGKDQYVMVNGVRLGDLDGQTIQAAIGDVLGYAVIEGGDPFTNHILYEDDLSGGERFTLLTDSATQTTIQYHHNAQLREITDTRLADRQAVLDLMDGRDAQQADVTAAESAVDKAQSQLNRLHPPSEGGDSGPSQAALDAYQQQSQALSAQLFSAQRRLATEQSALAEIDQQLQPHFDQQHDAEKTQLHQQIESIAGEAPLDALLQHYEDLLQQQQSLNDQQNSVNSAQMETARQLRNFDVHDTYASLNHLDVHDTYASLNHLQDQAAQQDKRLAEITDQKETLEARFEHLFTDYSAALAAPLEAELAQLQADLADQTETTGSHHKSVESAEFSDGQVALFNQMKMQMLESKVKALQEQIAALDDIEISDIEQMLAQKHAVTSALEEKVAQIDGYLSDSPIPEPASFGFDQQLRSNLAALDAGAAVAGLDLAGVEGLDNAHYLDHATRLAYEIRHHNRSHGEAELFDLYETDLSDLVFIKDGDSLTIYNRRLEDTDTPLEQLPRLVLSDFGQWSDDGMRLRFSNGDGERVETNFSLHALVRQFDSDGRVDMAQALADLYTANGGESMSAQEAKALRFGHFGQMNADGSLAGSSGDDLLAAVEGSVQAGGGDDTIVQSGLATHSDGGSGVDRVSYAASTEGVDVDLGTGKGSGGDAEGDSYTAVEKVTGSGHDDVLMGNAADNALSGGAGDDTLAGGAGADVLAGGEGVDTADYSGSDAGVQVHLSQEVDGQEVAGFGSGGDAEGDRLTAIENVIGSDHSDRVYGNAGDNVISGHGGDDRLYGGAGDDTLAGGEGSDHLFGGAGNDSLEGGAGDDLLMGGSGDDSITTGDGNDLVMGGSGDDAIDARSSESTADGSKIYKHIDGGSGFDTVTVDGSLADYELYEWGDGYRLISDTHDMNLVDIEGVYFADNLAAKPLELEHLYHLKKEQESREEAEEEALDSHQKPSGVQVIGGVSTAALIALAGQAAAAQALNPELGKTDEDKRTAEQLASLRKREEPGDGFNPPASQDADVAIAPITTSTDKSGHSNQETPVSIAPFFVSPSEKADADDVMDSPPQNNDAAIALEANFQANNEAKETADTKVPRVENQEALTTELVEGFETPRVSIAPLLEIGDREVDEDGSVALNIQVAGQNAHETLTVYISGVPEDARLDRGFLRTDGRWQLDRSELTEMRLYPGSNNDQDFVLDILVVSYDIDTQQNTSNQDQLSVTVHAIADRPNLTVADTSGNEDTAIPLTIQTSLNDTDGSETQHVIVSGVPTTAVLSNGEKQADGRWKLLSDQLDGLTIIPPANSSADFTLTVTSYASEGENASVATITETIDVVVSAVLDDLTITFEQSNNPVQPITYTNAAGELLGTGQGESITGDSADNVIKSDYLWQVPIHLSASAVAGEVIDWYGMKVKSSVGNPILHVVDGRYVLLFSKEELESVQGQNISVSIDIPHSTTDGDTGRVLSATTTESITIAVPSHFDSLGDTVHAGGGNDVVDGSASADSIHGEAGDDQISGHEGNDQLYGGAGNDTLIGGAGSDSMDGGSGDDVVYADLADLSKTLDGGTGADTMHLSDSGAVHLDNVQDIESVHLASGKDRLDLTENALVQNAGMTVDGGAGTDTLSYRGDGAGFIDQRFYNFEQVMVNLDDNGNVLTMRDDTFWDDATITGGNGQDIINIAEAGSYDLTGVDWNTIDKLTASADGPVAVKVDEMVSITAFSGDGETTNIDKIIGVGTGAALHIDMTRQQFSASLQNNTNDLIKSDDGNDTQGHLI